MKTAQRLTILQMIPRLDAGGAEQGALALNAALVQAGHRSLVMSAGGRLVEKILAAGGEHIVARIDRKDPLSLWQEAQRLRSLVRQEKISLLHARSRAPAWVAWLAQRQGAMLPLVTTFHAAYAGSFAPKKFYNSVMARSQAVIAISDYIAAHVQREFPWAKSRLTTIWRGIDLAKFHPAAISHERQQQLRALWHLAPPQRLILVPARLSPIKGQLQLLAALRQLRHWLEQQQVRVVLAGDAQGRVAYEAQLRGEIASSLQGLVQLAPHISDMPAALSLANLVLVPSQVPEGFGRVPVEAQAMGVPVLVSDLGALPEVMAPNAGNAVVPAADSAAWAKAIQAHLPPLASSSSATAAAQARRAFVQARFAEATMTEKTLVLYQQVVAKPPHAP